MSVSRHHLITELIRVTNEYFRHDYLTGAKRHMITAPWLEPFGAVGSGLSKWDALADYKDNIIKMLSSASNGDLVLYLWAYADYRNSLNRK